MNIRIPVGATLSALLLACTTARATDTQVAHRWDVFYTDAHDTLQSVDVYWNELSTGADVLLFAHGGGWLRGDKSTYRPVAESLASRGMTVVLVNYRLAPRWKFPSPVEDVAAAIAWARASAESCHGDPSRLFLMGHSAGAHLITLAVCDDRYLRPHGLAASDIAGVVAISGVFEIAVKEGGATPEFLGMVFGDDERVWADATCRNHVEPSMSGLPPFLFTWVAEEDVMIRDESEGIIEAFESAGLAYERFVFEGDDHDAFVRALRASDSPFLRRLNRFCAAAERTR
jgi:arylformamidase